MAEDKEAQAPEHEESKPDQTPMEIISGPSPGGGPLPIVGLCASAGGIAALEEFFDHTPAGSGLAFVVAVHLSPEHDSSLAQILQRHTAMPVSQIQDDVAVAANRVYVIPPNREIGLMHGRLQLLQLNRQPGAPLVVDSFLQSLAEDQGPRAIGVIFSGAGADGTLGLRVIKERGGLVIVQDPATAGHQSMPRSAIATGLADYVLPPAAMLPRLLNYVRGRAFRAGTAGIEPPSLSGDGLNKIFMLLRTQTGHDFTYYKHTTINRRVVRRLLVNQLDSLDDYVNFLRRHPEEVQKLFKELLIGVTHFFRDPEAFATLQAQALPGLFADRDRNQPVRVWVPGCATGEEAYSLAILLREQNETFKSGVEVQIFATDVDSDAINYARQGIYPAGIAQHLTPERLERYFIQENHTYEVRKEIREMVIFAEQSVIKDPPFSRLDLISCRNLLIYLEPDLQKSVLALFHYALRPGGILFLGPSESVGDFATYFTTVDRQWRLFRRTAEELARWPGVNFFDTLPADRPAPGWPRRRQQGLDHRQLVEKLLLEHSRLACAIVNEANAILYTYGPIDRYLKLVPGEMSHNILEMARPGLDLELTTAIRYALHNREAAVRRGIQVKSNGDRELIDMTVKPILAPPSGLGLFMVIFEPAAAPSEEPVAAAIAADDADKDPHVAALEQELRATRQYLQSALEEMQTAYEELKSTNEEMQSANEELQSSNEELKTSREELQSVNEELATVNMDFQTRNEQLTQANNDLHNLLRATHIATLFLDNRLRIRGFTPATTDIINLIASDVGRPLQHVVTNLRYEDLVADAEGVLETLFATETEVQTKAGRWYVMRILPYRTIDNVIDGLVITFGEITEQKQAQADLRQARDYAESIVNTLHEALLILDVDLRVVTANRSFYRQFQMAPAETEGQFVYDLSENAWDIPDLRRLLEEIIPEDSVIEGYEIEHDFPGIGRRRVRLNARRLQQDADGQPLIMLAIDDVTNTQQLTVNT